MTQTPESFFEPLFADLARCGESPRSTIYFLPHGFPDELIAMLLDRPGTAHILMENPDPVLLERFDGRLGVHPGPFDSLPENLPDASSLVFCYPARHIKARMLDRLLKKHPVRTIHHLWADSWRRRIPRLFLFQRIGRYLWLKMLEQTPISRLAHLALNPIQLLLIRKRHRRAVSRVLDEAPLERPEYFTPASLLLVTQTLGGGGAERQAMTTAIGLTGRGHDAAILCTQLHDQKENSFYLSHLEKRGVEVSQLRMFSPFRDVRLMTSPGLKGLPGWVAEEVTAFAWEFLLRRPGVVHVWQDMPHVALAAVLAGVPKVLLSWRSLSPRHYPLSSPLLGPAYRALVEHGAVHFTCNSSAGARDYAEWLAMPEERVTVLHNGLDPEAWKPDPDRNVEIRAELGIAPQAPVMGGIFRFVREKDPLLWIRVAAQVAKALPEARFVLFGDGPYLTQMERSAADLGIAEKLFLPGTTHQAARDLSVLDLFLLTSIIEGTPNVLIEAQLCGVPVVTTDAGGAGDTIDPGRTGHLASSRDPDEIARLAVQILKDRDWREAAGPAARRFATGRFSIERMLDDTLTAYSAPEPARQP